MDTPSACPSQTSSAGQCQSLLCDKGFYLLKVLCYISTLFQTLLFPPQKGFKDDKLHFSVSLSASLFSLRSQQVTVVPVTLNMTRPAGQSKLEVKQLWLSSHLWLNVRLFCTHTQTDTKRNLFVLCVV